MDKKTCLLHGCLPSHCGCPDSISQLDEYESTRVVGNLPPIARLAGADHLPQTGPYGLRERHVRKTKPYSMVSTEVVSITVRGRTYKP